MNFPSNKEIINRIENRIAGVEHQDSLLGQEIDRRCNQANKLVDESKGLWNMGKREEAGVKLWEAEQIIFPNMGLIERRAEKTKRMGEIVLERDQRLMVQRYDEDIVRLSTQDKKETNVAKGLALSGVGFFLGGVIGAALVPEGTHLEVFKLGSSAAISLLSVADSLYIKSIFTTAATKKVKYEKWDTIDNEFPQQ